ncbi:DUF6344 domain-containing protein [Streptomyces sp. NPDC060194]|uniref:DUF6344 domain-containing protein n=1 Tax=Streptomyces sp. NPDC060194 TaxID=3347069 RepID=UPI003665036E
MAVSKVSALWTALIGAFVALFAALGLTAPAAAAPRAAAPTAEPAGPAATEAARTVETTRAHEPDGPAPHGWFSYAPLPAAGSVPPTMKQRITAEAHGGVPASRMSSDNLARHAAVGASLASAE